MVQRDAAAAAAAQAAAREAQTREVQERVRDAAVSEPMLRPVRGGSLAIPSAEATGLVGQFSTRSVFGNENAVGVDYFLQANHLRLGRRWAVTILSETMEVDAPEAEIAIAPATAQPLTLLQRQTYASFGFRVSFSTLRETGTTSDAEFSGLFEQCMADRRSFAAADEATRNALGSPDAACPKLNLRVDRDGPQDSPSARAAYNYVHRHRYDGIDFFVGGRMMASAFDRLTSGEALGVAGEAGVNWRTGYFRASLAGFGMYLSDRTSQTDAVTRRQLGVQEYGGVLRLAYEGDAEVVGGEEFAPRAGGYVRFSRNLWTNAFSPNSAEVSGWQLEVGAYVSGHFLEGFSGLVGVSALVPYGRDAFEDITWVVTVSPSFGEPVGEGES
ncbi:MAG: hypothetical protein IT378_15495 [Sandaracinaceae bacterium]|nr:hypothetical protein [Sandaracinaceae bacterium]